MRSTTKLSKSTPAPWLTRPETLMSPSTPSAFLKKAFASSNRRLRTSPSNPDLHEGAFPDREARGAAHDQKELGRDFENHGNTRGSATPPVGGMAPAWAAMEALSRSLAPELGPHDIRVICLRSAGTPKTEVVQEVIGPHAKGINMTRDRFRLSGKARLFCNGFRHWPISRTRQPS
jgi:NAD(P)-dependent dehydrogenase (short-subunit alcohol dehydrogenase family)